MPRGDGTGPFGFGQRTGQGAGFCSGFSEPGFMATSGIGFSRCLGRGYGRGFGYRRMFHNAGYPAAAGFTRSAALYSEAEEKELLQKRAEVLEKQLNQVNGRLSALKRDD